MGTWLRRLRITSTVVFVAVLCATVALLVIAFIPRSPVVLDLPSSLLSGLQGVDGVKSGAVVDPEGTIPFSLTDPSLAQRLLSLATVLPGALVVAEVARRLAALLRAAEASDPFTAGTVRELTFIAKLTAFGGVGAWALASAAMSVLSSTVLDSGTAVKADGSPFWSLAVGFIFAAVAQLLARGVAMRAELDTVI
ncbi:DUF2975 domain-containing protein [Streptomyces sp. SID13031]|uniref:DUF2975 domain-containing protein n=1 Tax=Streptomyces sp. SID13031 TaxID=2706046 RepID=UPI0013CD3D3F|nr:DUF2975 domain-containing protein [Streptomyces sp. SID13031]NEA32296.1 DUF2975 domain-containing protein [Streptomyces sp. SID13031]